MRTTLFVLALAITQIVSACCGRISADIRYASVGGSSYRIDVIVYTCLTDPSDQPEIEVSFNQADGVLVPRTSITDDPAQNRRLSEYTSYHDLVGNGYHTVDAFIGERGGGVVNIPNSISEVMCIRALILVDASITSNSSIQYGTPPFLVTQNWNAFVHMPSPSDADGDSLLFELGIPRGLNCSPIAGYQIPLAVNFIWLDSETGTLIWDYPSMLGDYSISIVGSEYRNGQLIGQVTRDMTICVQPFEVGLAETTSSTAFLIRPTIATDQLWIDALGTWTVEVLDASGRAVIHGMQAGNSAPLDLSGLNAGTYLLRAVGTDGTRRTARFVKTR